MFETLARPARRSPLLLPLIAALAAAPAAAADPPAKVLVAAVGQPAAPAVPPATTPLPPNSANRANVDLAPLRARVAADPGDRAALRLLGDAAVSDGAYDQAADAYEHLVKLSPGDKTAHERLGRIDAAIDRIDEAIAQFEASLPDVAAYADLVTLHRRLGDLPAFVASYRDKAQNAPFDAVAQYGYGVILRRIHEPDRALEQFLIARRLEGRDRCPILDEMGNAYLDLGRSNDAIAVFERCLKIEPDDYAALVDESVARMDASPDVARAELDRAVALKPDHPEAYVNLGYLADSRGDAVTAAAEYDRAIGYDPFFRDAYVDLGYTYLETGRLQAAEETFLRGLSVSHDDGRMAYLLGETLAKQGKPRLADRAYTIALRSDEPEVAAAAKRVLGTH